MHDNDKIKSIIFTHATHRIGDSGGPLLCPLPGEQDRWFVGGIVSIITAY